MEERREAGRQKKEGCGGSRVIGGDPGKKKTERKIDRDTEREREGSSFLRIFFNVCI